MPKAHVTWKGKMQFVGQDRYDHEVLMEASPQYGGEGKGITPMEMLLAALGGCAGIDIVTMLKARGQNLASYDVAIEGVRRDEHPKSFKEIEVRFTFGGQLDRATVDRVVNLTMRRLCPIAHMLDKTSSLKWSCEIVGATAAQAPEGMKADVKS